MPQQHFDFEFLNEIADPIATDGTNTMFVTRSRPLTSHFAVAVFPRLPSTSHGSAHAVWEVGKHGPRAATAPRAPGRRGAAWPAVGGRLTLPLLDRLRPVPYPLPIAGCLAASCIARGVLLRGNAWIA